MMTRPLGHGRADPGRPIATPRDAATLIIWREGKQGTEVLMGQRNRASAFLPGFFVFPGGRVDAEDYSVNAATPLESFAVLKMNVGSDRAAATAIAIAAVRETAEETGLMLADDGDVGAAASAFWADWKRRGIAPGLSRLTYFGRAITSPISPIRFDARFFIVHADSLQGEIAGSDELQNLSFHAVTEILSGTQIVDVTEFMLNRVLAYAANRPGFETQTPLFSYDDDVAVIRYE